MRIENLVGECEIFFFNCSLTKRLLMFRFSSFFLGGLFFRSLDAWSEDYETFLLTQVDLSIGLKTSIPYTVLSKIKTEFNNLSFDIASMTTTRAMVGHTRHVGSRWEIGYLMKRFSFLFFRWLIIWISLEAWEFDGWDFSLSHLF